MKQTKKSRLLSLRARKGVTVRLVESAKKPEPERSAAPEPEKTPPPAPPAPAIEVQVLGAKELRDLISNDRAERADFLDAILDATKRKPERGPWRFEVTERDERGNIKALEAHPLEA